MSETFNGGEVMFWNGIVRALIPIIVLNYEHASQLAKPWENGKACNRGKRTHIWMDATSCQMCLSCLLGARLLQVSAVQRWLGHHSMRALLTSFVSHYHNGFSSPPDFKSRETESNQMDVLLATDNRYPHAWYARRFFNKVTVSETPGSHFGMGLDCYVQWSSPIRRLTDLQVHSALKRYLRRKRVNEMLREGLPVPSELTSMDLGYDVSKLQGASSDVCAIDPIDYTTGLAMISAARPIQSSSSNYWLFEYIRRMVDGSDEEVMFESIVLGCVNRDRSQYAIYVYELGLEFRYLSETGKLSEGKKLWLKVSFVNPRMELLTFSLASRSGGIHAQKSPAPAA